MGGRIWVEREPSRGSTFHFTVSLERAKESDVAARFEPPSLVGVSALVVDDNATNRRILGDALRRWGMDVDVVGDGETALATLARASEAKRRIDVVLLDCCMPRMDGFAVAQHIKDTSGDLRPTIMMLTSDSQRATSARCRELGIALCLIKPVGFAELVRGIRMAVSTASPTPERPVVPLETATPRKRALAERPLRVLLAEDNRVNQQLATGILRARPPVTVAEDGQKAIDAWRSGAFDVVLMDMQMPVMGGFDATQAIRARERESGGHVPIVALTARAMTGDREACLLAGMDDYLSKPLKPSALVELIARLASRAPPIREVPVDPRMDG